jgi:hypothetical protein
VGCLHFPAVGDAGARRRSHSSAIVRLPIQLVHAVTRWIGMTSSQKKNAPAVDEEGQAKERRCRAWLRRFQEQFGTRQACIQHLVKPGDFDVLALT